MIGARVCVDAQTRRQPPLAAHKSVNLYAPFVCLICYVGQSYPVYINLLASVYVLCILRVCDKIILTYVVCVSC